MRPSGPNPKATATAVGGLFFPQSKSLGIDQTEISPALLQKISYAGTASCSFAQGSATLHHLADLTISVKQVERITKTIGNERVDERKTATAAFQDLPLVDKFKTPPHVEPPKLAVVMADGGRLQILDRTPAAAVTRADDGVLPGDALASTSTPVSAAVLRADDSVPPGDALASTSTPASAAAPSPIDWEEETPAKKGHWREDKVGLLLSMESETSTTDPCPEIPASFLDVLRITKVARQLKKTARAGEDAVADTEEPEAAAEALANEEVYKPPQVLSRQTVASRESWPTFAPELASAAWSLGLQGAARKAFVADGSANNWTLQRRFFASFTPILDFIHVLSYVFAAAMAGRKFADGWARYQEWIRWVWQGQVVHVIKALQERQLELGTPTAEEAETSPRQVVSKALGYFENHQDKMKYEEYRKAGLPITSSLMESTVKQINQRVKGTEKFWSEEGSEALLQLRADQLGDEKIVEAFWERRQENATGQKRYRRVG